MYESLPVYIREAYEDARDTDNYEYGRYEYEV